MSSTAHKINLNIPKIYAPLFKKENRCRYYVFHGGRGSGKSWNVARTLIIKAYSQRHRILCCREYQRSLADSVHRLLTDQIKELGLEDYFTITNDRIICKTTGSEFLFRGLHANSDQIKSLEGITIVWIEEAHSTTKESLDYLIPTIRTEGSEIWITFNPKDETDEVYKRFVLNPPEDAFVKQVNYYDNPYFPEVLRKEMEHSKQTDYDRYKNVWLGEPLVISDALIFRNKWSVKYFVPPENADYQQGVDFGFAADASVLIRCYELQEGSEKNLYICDEAYGLHVPSEQLHALFNQVRESDRYVTNCDCSRPETIYTLQRTWNPSAVGERKQAIEDRISYIMSYNNIFIHPNCEHIIEEFRNYKYKTDSNGNITRTPIDKWNHCIDALSYALFYKIRSNSARVIQQYSTSFSW